MMALVEGRYAEALADMAAESDDLEGYRRELEQVSRVLAGSPDLGRILLNPSVELTSRKQLITAIFSGLARKEMLCFMQLLLDKGRFGCLPGILTEFRRITDERSGLLTVKLSSAMPLENEQAERIGQIYRKMHGAAAVRIDPAIDPGLVGGVRVAAAGRLTDGSVAGRLEDLRRILSRNDEVFLK